MPHEMRGALYRRVSLSGDSLGGPELHHQSAGGEVGGLGEGGIHDLPVIVPYLVVKNRNNLSEVITVSLGFSESLNLLLGR